jgi:hypothetical protein
MGATRHGSTTYREPMKHPKLRGRMLFEIRRCIRSGEL